MTARLKVRVIPNARKSEFSGYREDEHVLRLNAPPSEGKANRAALEFVSEFFDVPRTAIRLVSGEKSRHKVFEILGLKEGDIERKLASASR